MRVGWPVAAETPENLQTAHAVGEEVQASFLLVSRDPDGAKDVADKINNGLNLAKGIVSLQAQNLKALEPLVEFLDSLKVATQGSTVTLNLTGNGFYDFVDPLAPARMWIVSVLVLAV